MRHSETLAKLCKALVGFQGALSNPPTSAVNPFFKSRYAPLNAILDHVRDLAYRYGLAFVQAPTSPAPGSVGVVTIIVHDSGEWMELGELVITPAKAGPQDLIAALTYARRGSLSAALNVCGDPDNDGNDIAPRADTKRPPNLPDNYRIEPAEVPGREYGLLDQRAQVRCRHLAARGRGLPLEAMAAYEDRIDGARTAADLEAVKSDLGTDRAGMSPEQIKHLAARVIKAQKALK